MRYTPKSLQEKLTKLQQKSERKEGVKPLHVIPAKTTIIISPANHIVVDVADRQPLTLQGNGATVIIVAHQFAPLESKVAKNQALDVTQQINS